MRHLKGIYILAELKRLNGKRQIKFIYLFRYHTVVNSVDCALSNVKHG